MESQPAYDNPHLLPRQRTGQQLAINSDFRFMLTVIDMHMRFMVLSIIAKKHADNHTAEPAKFWHYTSPFTRKNPASASRAVS